jgi:hypothetical protein
MGFAYYKTYARLNQDEKVNLFSPAEEGKIWRAKLYIHTQAKEPGR